MNRNTLISLLPKKVKAALLLKAEIIEFNLSEIICLVGHPTHHVYFPMNGFISLIQNIDQHPSIEVGMIGREGVLGAEVVLGMNVSPFGALVQGVGNAFKISTDDFLTEVNKNPELKMVINHYLLVRINQLGLSVGCEHFHSIASRLAKWLLMSQDRAQSDRFMMTHEFISLMLGVRRVGVTTTAADFKRRGLIDYHRGEMQVIDRAALKAEACSCYQNNKNIFSNLIN